MILFIGNEASRTGAPLVLLDLVKFYSAKEEVVVLLSKGGQLYNEYAKYGKVYIWEYGISGKKNLFVKLYYKFIKTKNNYRKNIIKEISDTSPKIIFNNTIANGEIVEAFQFMNVPIVTYIHEMEYIITIFDTLYNRSSTKTIKNSHSFIAVSNAVKQNLIVHHNITAEKITVISGTIPNYYYDKISQYPNEAIDKIKKEKKFIIGCVGNLRWHKGDDLFLRLADKMINQLNMKDVSFIWVGGDSNDINAIQFSFEVKRLKLNDSVIHIPHIKDTSPYYQSFDIFVNVSREDSFPISVLEAALHGLPVISFRESGGAEEFVSEDCGFSVSYLNIDEMAEKILLLKNDRTLYITCSENIKAKVKSYTNTNNMDAIYRYLKHIENTFVKSV